MPYNASENEKKVLDFWKEDGTFEKSVNERPADQLYVFYDGPPFATGLPHYGHIVASVMKDVVPRYYTMKGHRVERVWGWDCHGLPIENIVEKELQTKSKKDIEEMGVEKFNELCRSKVLGYVTEWEKTVHRLGRWVDMENAYRTMDKEYMESVWWVFKQLWDKGFIHKGHRSMHVCPRCETTLSQQEVSEGYKNVKDLSVITKFPITDQAFLDDYCGGEPTSFIAWTTTPWSIPTTMGLAIGPEFTYSVLKYEGGQVICARERIEYVAEFMKEGYEIVNEMKGRTMEHVSYTHPWGDVYGSHPDVAGNKEVYKTHLTEYVSVEDGTGLVTINGAFGEIDMEAAQRIGLPIVTNVGMNGIFSEEMGELAGVHVKPEEDRMATDVAVVKYLAKKGHLFAKKKYEHSYPHCWRCDTPLLNYATDSWFVSVTKVKERALALAKDINWSPGHIKEGRFGKWLEGARDWSISRQRFWASVIPIWESEDGDQMCFGSVAELEELSGQKIDDLHKHVVDKVTFEKDGKTYARVPDVLDTWFDSGSMPYAQVHYPYENKEKFEGGFPAEFIAEGQDQTRAWFYYLHVIASAIMDKPAFKNVIVNGIVLAEDGKKMSKKLQNYPDPNEVLERYGADSLRFYLLSSPVMQAENLNFSEEGVREVFNKVINTVANVLSFYQMFAGDEKAGAAVPDSSNVLDQWIMARLNELKTDVTEAMEAYNLVDASRPIMDFVLDLSQWYVRNSRARFKGSDDADKAAALETLGYVLAELAKVMAPFMPFMAETIYHDVTGNETSVHLETWPAADHADESVLEQMVVARKVVEMGHASRKEAALPVRQPLAVLAVATDVLSDELKDIVAAELNVKEVRVEKDVTGLAGSWVGKEDGELHVAVCTDISDELKKEGLLREVVRAINNMRKQQGLTRDDRVTVSYKTGDALLASVFTDFADELSSAVHADSIAEGSGDAMQVDKRDIELSIKAV